MVLIEDDSVVNPTIPEPRLQYIIHLPDSHQAYTRFFDGLLISRPSHSAFLRDLKSFRSQAVIIALLSSCGAGPDTPKEVTRKRYRDVTKAYLASVYAHPWCRKAMGGSASSKGWWGAQWSATGRKMSTEAKEQEEKLHKLLVPIWIVMRGRMFPGDEVVDAWYQAKLAKEQEERRTRAKRLEGDLVDSTGKTDTRIDVSEVNVKAERRESQGIPINLNVDGNEVNPSKSCTNMRQDFWASEEAAEMQDELETRDRQAAHAATSVFRLAAAGLILDSMPKKEKWKLRKLLKR